MGGLLVCLRSQLNISNMQINMSWFAALALRFAGILKGRRRLHGRALL